jgi:DNA-binding MarR family transcriptional regulator
MVAEKYLELSKSLESFRKDNKITEPELRIIIALGKAGQVHDYKKSAAVNNRNIEGQGIRPRELSDLVEVQSSSIAQSVKSLREKRILNHRKYGYDRNDERKVGYTLTQHGYGFYCEIISKLGSLFDEGGLCKSGRGYYDTSKC